LGDARPCGEAPAARIERAGSRIVTVGGFTRGANRFVNLAR
jgi:hypothetical protein